jgi:hypothetical protein
MGTSYCKEQPKKKEEDVRMNKSRKKRQELETQAQTVLTLDVDQITWSMLSLKPKSPLAHYPEFIACLATTLFKN